VVVIEVKTETGGGTGTGIIMTADGYIATNHHVIEGATKIKVTFYDGTVLEAETVGSSEMDDLGVIKVAATGLPAATFAYSENCYVGQTVYAIGTPAGPDFGWTTTKGIISYKNREVKIYDDDDGTLQKKLRLLQTDANVNPGNSGGPLINTAGEVVGVVSMKLSNGYEGMGFAIPSDGAVEILEAIKEKGHANDINSSLSHKRPMLGVTGVYMTEGVYYLPDDTGVKAIPENELSKYDKDQLICPAASGVYVMGFAEGMDAAAKLQVGDVITAIEGEKVDSVKKLSSVVNRYYAGDIVTLTVYRGNGQITVDIILSAQPD
jgi:serine protease Do